MAKVPLDAKERQRMIDEMNGVVREPKKKEVSADKREIARLKESLLTQLSEVQFWKEKCAILEKRLEAINNV